MEIRLAILGGVIPAAILGAILVLAGLLKRGPSPRRNVEPSVGPDGAQGPPVPSSDAPRRPRQVGVAWIAGSAIALPIIHYASWSWPTLWPSDATYRFLHTAALLLLWALVDVLVPRCPSALRHVGRFLALAAAIGVLLHAYLGVLGWAKVLGGASAAALLATLFAVALTRAQARYHPALVLTAQFLACAGAVGVLILGRTATAAQAAAGLAALFAATGVASLITRRSTPHVACGFVLSGLLAWLLAVGCFATAQTNLASSILLMLVPLGWAVPIPRFNLFWKRIAPGVVVGVAWTLLCVGSALAVAVLTQPPSPPDYAS